MKMFPFGLLFSLSALGADLLNVGLQVNLEYSDLDYHCKLSALNQPFRLAVEIRDREVVRARLKKESWFGSSLTRDLSEDEVGNFQVLEEAGLMWFKKVYLSSETVNLLLFAGEGFGKDSCIPPQGIREAMSEPILFDFGIDSVGHLLPHLIHSNEVVLRGVTQEGNPFRIKLSLTQDRR